MFDPEFVAYVKALQEGDLLKVGDVATLTGVVPQTVSRWAKAGLLTYVKTPGGHYRFRPSDLAIFLEEYQLVPNNGRFPRKVE